MGENERITAVARPLEQPGVKLLQPIHRYPGGSWARIARPPINDYFIIIDTASEMAKNNLFDISNDNWKEWRLDNGLEVLFPGNFNTTVDDQGNIYIYPEGDIYPGKA